MNVDTGEFRALAAEVERIGKLMNIVTVRIEETLAAAFPHINPAARPAPARQVRRRSDRPHHLRPVDGSQR